MLSAPWLLPNDLPPWEVVYQQMARWIHIAVDTLEHLLAAHVTSASEQACAQVGELSKAVQDVTGESVELAYVDQGNIGAVRAAKAESHGIKLEVVKLPETKPSFLLLPR